MSLKGTFLSFVQDGSLANICQYRPFSIVWVNAGNDKGQCHLVFERTTEAGEVQWKEEERVTKKSNMAES